MHCALIPVKGLCTMTMFFYDEERRRRSEGAFRTVVYGTIIVVILLVILITIQEKQCITHALELMLWQVSKNFNAGASHKQNCKV